MEIDDIKDKIEIVLPKITKVMPPDELREKLIKQAQRMEIIQERRMARRKEELHRKAKANRAKKKKHRR